MSARYDLVVIGGGFYGLRIALHASEKLGMRRVAVVDREPEMMNRASYVNQARVHNGYHYPRSILTAYRSRVNFPRFVDEYAEAIDWSFEHHYAIARRLSKTSARQFELFCTRIGARYSLASADVARLFSPHLIQDVYLVEEPAFDARVLRELLIDRIHERADIELFGGIEALTVAGGPAGTLVVETSGRALSARHVISAAYSGLNAVHRASGLPIVGLQHELARISLVTVPPVLHNLAVTVMDGPFFSLMPFPARGLHSLTHVRHTPVRRWHDTLEDPVRDVGRELAAGAPAGFEQMQADAARYLPAVKQVVLEDSMVEVKTVLSRSMSDDSRPIYFSADHGLANYTCVMGGKLDNIYDVLDELDRTHA